MGNKYYVVWNGVTPGIYPSWEECRLQIEGYPNASYKGFNSKEEAILAYRGNPREQLGLLKGIAQKRKETVTDASGRNDEIRRDAIAVDGACSGNPGPVEYRGVRVDTGQELFHVGPYPGGSNNIGEYLAMVHALALLDRMGDRTTSVYVDSLNSFAWLKKRKCGTKVVPTDENRYLFELIARADRWLQSHPNIPNPVLKWHTAKWGEIPADFGRK